MLLAIDCGNTNIVFALYDGQTSLGGGVLRPIKDGQQMSILRGSVIYCP